MSSHHFAFLTKASFLGVTENQSACAYAVAGIAYDGATTNRPSHMLCDGVHPLWNRSPVSALTDVGDLAQPNTGLTAMRETWRRFWFGRICVGGLRRQKLEVDTTRTDLSFPRRRESI